jgi:hypothetical protein
MKNADWLDVVASPFDQESTGSEPGIEAANQRSRLRLHTQENSRMTGVDFASEQDSSHAEI